MGCSIEIIDMRIALRIASIEQIPFCIPIRWLEFATTGTP